MAGAAVVMAAAGCGSSDRAQAPASTGTASAPGSTAADSTGGTAAAASTDVGRLVDIGDGRSIYLECRGTGGPTVVLVSGLGDRADTWMGVSDDAPTVQPVFAGVEGFTRVCAYDRPGTATATDAGFEPSRSTPVPEPATVGDSADDLHRLLDASGEPGPYVVVGHSLGGPIARLYAAAHPDDVAGLVLEDALSEDVVDGLTPDEVESFEELNAPETQGRPAGSEQDLYATAVVPLLRAAPPAPRVPTVILTADRWPFTAEVIEAGHASGAIPAFVTPGFTDALWAAQVAAQGELAAAFPWAEHVTETNATHYIHLDNPQLVIDSIRDVVEQAR